MNETLRDQLDAYFQQVQRIILDRQHPISGLLPASTAVTTHGNYTDAWVRDNVYSILAAWGLALAYRQQQTHSERAYILEQSVVKLMRGLLLAMMRQSDKVERFKHTQDPLDALHAKYSTNSGEAVVADHEWGHLQLDATSLYLLMLAQMTKSGLRIVFNYDEVNFVQNLVHYISRAYRTPDYGIWERGNKMNHGIAEINASSVGMAKAALEAMNGCNLFGSDGQAGGVIHVISDTIARTRIVLQALLPRESISKEVDAAVLSITGFPAFAVDDADLRADTEARIVEKLQGRYGCKRFLLDGHQTVLEDHQRLHYEPHELKQFMDIECEWPLFFCYLQLNHLFAGRAEQAEEYRTRLQTLCVEQNGVALLPELYWVPREAVEAEKAQPHSQPRLPNENVPLVWAQSLYLLASMLQDGLIGLDDIDPLGRHRIQRRNQPTTVRIALLAEDNAIQQRLKQQWMIDSQTAEEIAPIEVRDSFELAQAYTQVGRNDRLGLSGRPLRQLRTLASARLYLLAGQALAFVPQFISQQGFYLALDNRLLIQRLHSELNYISQHWDESAPPLIVLPIKRNLLEGDDCELLIEFLHQAQAGQVEQTPVALARLTDCLQQVCRERIDFLHDFRFAAQRWSGMSQSQNHALPAQLPQCQPVEALRANEWEQLDEEALLELLSRSDNLYAQLELLTLLVQRHGLAHSLLIHSEPVSIRALLEAVYAQASDWHLWYVVRRCAGLLGKYDIELEQAATDLLVRQHAITLGRSYSNKATLQRPTDSWQILEIIRTFNPGDTGLQILIQELLVHLGLLIKLNPGLFKDLHTIRIGHILQLMLARHKRQTSTSLDHAYNDLLAMAPHELAQRLRETLEDYNNSESQLGAMEQLHYEGERPHLTRVRFTEAMNPRELGSSEDWYAWREQSGSVGRENDSFFDGVWAVLHHCRGLMVGEKYNSKRRIDSESVLAQMTRGEQSFKLHITHILNKIQAPVYRQLSVEALRTLAYVVREHPEVYIDDTLVTDILIGHAVRIHWLQQYPHYRDDYEACVALAWQAFYQLPPHVVANSIIDALIHLLNLSNPEN